MLFQSLAPSMFTLGLVVIAVPAVVLLSKLMTTLFGVFAKVGQGVMDETSITVPGVPVDGVIESVPLAGVPAT